MKTNTPPGLLVHNKVSTASKTARSVVLLAFGATALLAASMTLERMVFKHSSQAAVQEIKSSLTLASTVLLEDERLTAAANFSALTGQPKWLSRYEEHLKLIDEAIAQATHLAPPGAAERFDKVTRVANDKLVFMERTAFARVAAGDLPGAQAFLLSPEYAMEKKKLSAGTDAFMDELQQSAQHKLLALEQQSTRLGLAFLALAALSFWLLWRLLVRRLADAERAFNDKQDEVSRLALHDPLTGLANRRCLHLKMTAAMARAGREHARFALLMIDLDGFKPVNDRHGHTAGDEVLVEIGRRLAASVRKDEIVARLGGDEFVVVLHLDGQADPELNATVKAAHRLIASLSEAIELESGPVRVSASVGVAFFPADGNQTDDLIRKADVALYRAKNEARGDVRFFQNSMDEDVRQRDALSMDLRLAISGGGITPHFQPLIDLATGRLTGFEVLARWSHPTLGWVAPTVFVPIAEDSGQIDALTVCVMRQALLAACDWDPALTLAVNIAPKQLKDETLVERLMAVLDETGFPPDRFEVEITENALIGDLALARRIVLGLKARGIRVALDDFGTGYSSLSHLSDLPFDKIKIDRSFVQSMHSKRESATIINAIIGLGHSLNLPTTAEGIESAADAELLTRLGCHMGQGYLYSQAVAATEVPQLMRRLAASARANNNQTGCASAD